MLPRRCREPRSQVARYNALHQVERIQLDHSNAPIGQVVRSQEPLRPLTAPSVVILLRVVGILRQVTTASSYKDLLVATLQRTSLAQVGSQSPQGFVKSGGHCKARQMSSFAVYKTVRQGALQLANSLRSSFHWQLAIQIIQSKLIDRWNIKQLLNCMQYMA